MTLWMEKNGAGGEYDGDLGEWHLGGDNAGGEHDGDHLRVLDMSLAHQTSWIWVSM